MAASSPADRPRGLSGLLGRAGRWLRRLVRPSTPEPSPRPRPGIGIERLPIRPSRLMIGYYLQHLRRARRRQLVTTAGTVDPSGESLGPAGRPSHQELTLQHRRPPLLTRRSTTPARPSPGLAATAPRTTHPSAHGLHPHAHKNDQRNAHKDGARSAQEDARSNAHDDARSNAHEDGAQAMAGGPLGSYPAPGPLGRLASRVRSERVARRSGLRAGLTGRVGAASVGRDSAVRARGYATPTPDQHRPEQAWQASVATDPLETPIALPGQWTPLVRVITGRSHARFTTGAATRRALTSAGARGATSGTTLHLPRVPTAGDLPVVAHELAHSRMPLARPRFLLGHAHVGDADERAAHATAGAATHAISPTYTTSTMNRPHPTAPDVGRLPVTGLGGLPHAVSNLIDRAGQTSRPGRPGSGDTAHTATNQNSSDRSRPASPTTTTDPSGSITTTGSNSSTGSTTNDITTDTTNPPGAAAAAVPDLDQLIESLETRLIRELERRGGRFADVF